jgi:F-type H+-transporting ATPase subunit delta
MAELITVARPYAEAVFSLAREKAQSERWSDALQLLVAMANNPDVVEAITSPKHTAEEIEALLLSVVGEQPDEDIKNFVKLLIANHRTLLLPEIERQFELLSAQAANILDASVESAFGLNAEQKAELTATLSKIYGKSVRLDVLENPELIGGVRVLVGDDVIDASVRGKLQAMAASLKN